jgi:predicted RNase H-like HicB family nuclease
MHPTDRRSILVDAMTNPKGPHSERSRHVRFNFEIDRETDGRWIAEIPEVPGAMAYGVSEEEAKAKAYALALYAIADDVEKSKNIPDSISVLPISA